jgi:hypothetical protein
MASDPLRGIRPRAYRDLIAIAVAQGWTVAPTKGNHWKLTPPDDGPFIICAHTSGGGRGVQNLRSMLRKRGVEC